jgi:hypothetical protein
MHHSWFVVRPLLAIHRFQRVYPLGKNTLSNHIPTPPSSLLPVLYLATVSAAGIALLIATLYPASWSMATSFPPSPKARTCSSWMGSSDFPGCEDDDVKELEEFRMSRSLTSAVPLLCSAGMSSRQKGRACVVTNEDEGKAPMTERTATRR